MRSRPCAFALLSFVATFLILTPGSTEVTTGIRDFKNGFRSAREHLTLPSRGQIQANPFLSPLPSPLQFSVCDVQLLPTSQIQEAIDSHPPGTSFCFLRGTYQVSSLRPKDGNSFVGQLGAVLTGADSARYAFNAFSSPASNVTIAGLVIEHFNPPLQQGAIQSGPGWTIRDNEFRNNAAAGLFFGSSDKVLRNSFHHNGQQGLKSYRSTDSLVEGNEIAYNNTRNIDMDWEAGGGKFAATARLTLRNNYVHDNKGTGLWTDFDNHQTRYEGNRVENNYLNGIFHEISYDAVIRNNIVTGNATSWRGGIWRAGILVASSSNVEVYGNTVSGNGNGISGTEQNRGSGARGPWILRNLHVHDNTITMSQGQTGIEQTNGNKAFSSRSGNRFARNTYYVRSADCTCFRWRGSSITKERWVATGHDTSGRFYGL
jgi:parallel beta-helix repeat protein